MRIIFNGQQAFGKACLEAMLERGDDVIAVFCAPGKEGGPMDPVKEFALEKGLPVHQPKSYKDADTLALIRRLKPDLCVLAYVTVFIPREAREIPTHGTICFHPSLLPLHRGPSSINWPIIGGATQTGLTIFYPDDGLDEGDILLQKTVDIGPDDTLGSVYFKKIFPLGVEAVLEAVDLLAAGNAPRVKQDDSNATYESWCRKEDARIDWSRPVADVYNLIRGTNPQPGAWTTQDGRVLKIFDCARLDEAAGAPGQVTRVSEEGFAVAAGGGAILVKRVMPEGSKKMPADEFARDGGVREGDVLGGGL